MGEKDVMLKMTAVEGGVPLAKTISYPKLTVLQRAEQKETWKNQLKNAEQQVQAFYMMARAYPRDTDKQEAYAESVEALENLRQAHQEWLASG